MTSYSFDIDATARRYIAVHGDFAWLEVALVADRHYANGDMGLFGPGNGSWTGWTNSCQRYGCGSYTDGLGAMPKGWGCDLSAKETNKPTGARRNHSTQWAAQFAVASELCKRGYEVAFTSGNATPLVDLIVVSPIGKVPFLVDVKGLYRRNPWIVKRNPARQNLFYILAFVPRDEPNRFFILTQADANKLIQDELTRLGRADNYRVTGFVWKLAENFEDKWKKLPQ